MKNTFRTSRHLSLLLSVLLSSSVIAAKAEERQKEAADPSPPAQKVEEISGQAKEVLGWATELSKEITQTLEGWITSSAITQEKLFAFLYYPVTDTDPTKFTTDYDALADRDFQAIIDKYAAKSNLVIYAVATDRNGYVPTHNRQFSQPLTGNRAVDLVNNRTKRIFGDQIGFRAARNQKPYLLQSYARDTGEMAADLSIPLIVRGKHWGCVRIGFRQVDRQQ